MTSVLFFQSSHNSHPQDTQPGIQIKLYHYLYKSRLSWFIIGQVNRFFSNQNTEKMTARIAITVACACSFRVRYYPIETELASIIHLIEGFESVLQVRHT
jgi:hypothetical protein